MKDAGVNAHAGGANVRDDFVDVEARAWSEGQLWTRLYGPENSSELITPHQRRRVDRIAPDSLSERHWDNCVAIVARFRLDVLRASRPGQIRDNQMVLGQPPLTPTLTAKTVSVHKRALTDCISGRLVQTMRVLGVTVPNDPLPR